MIIIPIFNVQYYANKSVDIKFDIHDTFLEWPSSGILKVK
jgi:hypothetical protein